MQSIQRSGDKSLRGHLSCRFRLASWCARPSCRGPQHRSGFRCCL